MTAAASSAWDDDFFEEAEKETYDDFFAAEGSAATANVAAKAFNGPSSGDAVDIEAEYEHLSQSSGRRPEQGVVAGTVASFAMDDSDDDVDMSAVQSAFVQDCRPPELPAPPTDFSPEDLRLREALADFYMRHLPANVVNVNSLTTTYRGCGAPQLWASLAVKYNLPPADAVDILSGVLYVNSAFEFGSKPAVAERTAAVELELSALAAKVDGDLAEPSVRATLIENAIDRGAESASDDLLRLLCFRGLQDRQEMRGQAWKILLGYLPIAEKASWPTIEAEKRALYAARKSELLVVTSDYKLEIKAKGGQLMDAVEMLQQIQKDIDRTHQDLEIFRRPAVRAALICLLFVYAQLNPDVRYVQGMNEIAAMLLYALEAQLPRLSPEHTEADAFWTFSMIMEELKVGFTKALDGGVPRSVAAVDRLLRAYDPELARHLQSFSCPLSVFTFRWCTLLFSQDVALLDCLRFWDSFIADPCRFEFVLHMCLGILLGRREELLHLREQGALAEALRAAPRSEPADVVLRRSWAICAFERRGQAPLFPQKGASQLVEDLSGWAQSAAERAKSSGWFQTAAATAQELRAAAAPRAQEFRAAVAPKAQEIRDAVAQKVQDHVDPSVKQTVGQASGNVKVVAQGGVQAMKAWLAQDSPVPAPLTQPETYANAQAKVASLWQTMRTSGADAVTKTQQLVAQHNQREKDAV